MPVVQDLADMYKAVDAAATVNLLAKLAVEKSYHAKLDDTRSSLAVSLMIICGGAIMQCDLSAMHEMCMNQKLPDKCPRLLVVLRTVCGRRHV